METKVTSHPFDWPGEEQKVRVRPSLRSPKFVTRVCRADLQVGTSLKTKRAYKGRQPDPVTNLG